MFKIGIAMKFCGSTYQVMRQQWLERGLTPCPGRAPAGSRPALALAAIPNPCTRQGWVLGIPSHLRAVGPWEHSILPACPTWFSPCSSPTAPRSSLPQGCCCCPAHTLPTPQTGASNPCWCFWLGQRTATPSVPSSCYPTANPHAAALFSWPLFIHMVMWKPCFSLKEGKFPQMESPHSCKDQFENAKWEPGHPAEDGVGAVVPGLTVGHPWWWVVVALPCTWTPLVLETLLLGQS